MLKYGKIWISCRLQAPKSRMDLYIDVANGDQPRYFGASTRVSDKSVYGWSNSNIYTVEIKPIKTPLPGLCQYGTGTNFMAMLDEGDDKPWDFWVAEVRGNTVAPLWVALPFAKHVWLVVSTLLKCLSFWIIATGSLLGGSSIASGEWSWWQ